MAFADKICMKKGRENSMSPLDIAYISYMNCWYSPTELYDYIKTDGATIKSALTRVFSLLLVIFKVLNTFHQQKQYSMAKANIPH